MDRDPIGASAAAQRKLTIEHISRHYIVSARDVTPEMSWSANEASNHNMKVKKG